jgi:flagellin
MLSRQLRKASVLELVRFRRQIRLLHRVQDIILEMKVLAQQGQSDTIGDSEREAIQYEIRQYADEINDIASDTNWQGVSLLDGTMNWTLQVGEKSSDTIQVSVSSSTGKGFDIASLGLNDLTVTDAKSAAESWAKLNDAESMCFWN